MYSLLYGTNIASPTDKGGIFDCPKQIRLIYLLDLKETVQNRSLLVRADWQTAEAKGKSGARKGKGARAGLYNFYNNKKNLTKNN